MPVYYSRATGNINATNVWATTPTGTAGAVTIAAGDVLMAQSGHTITINVNTTATEIRNDSTNGATGGGSFILNDGVTLTANVFCGTTTVLNYNGSTPNSASIVGSVTGGTSGSATQAVSHGGSGTLNITGTVTGGSGTGANGVGLMTAGTLNIVGNVFGSPTVGASGVRFGASNGTVNITGTVTGGAVADTGVGVNIQLPCTVNITGVAVGGIVGQGVNVNASATVTITRARGNGFGNGSVGLSPAVGVQASQTSSVRVSEIEYGALGQSPTGGPVLLSDATSNVAIFYRLGGGQKTLTDPAATADFPANSNVRSGTVFANGNRTGTCAVPAAGSVALGVAVDNTTGTAVLTSAAAQSACNSALTAFSSGRLANVATVDSTGAQVAAAFGQ